MNLHSPRILTSTRTQGRFGNGHGVEYTEEYFVEYWRPGFNKWVRWRNRRGMEVRIYTHTHTYTFCSMPIDSKPITYSTFSSFSFDLDLLTFRISFFFVKNIRNRNTNGIFCKIFVRIRFGSFLSTGVISEDGIFFYFNFDFVLPTLLSGSVTPKYFKL